MSPGRSKQGSGSKASKRDGDDEGPSRRARLVSGAVAAVLLAGFLTVCVQLDLQRGSEPARVEGRVLSSATLGGDEAVVVEARNRGDVTAEDVTVRIEGSGGADADPVEQSIDFLAPNETEEFTLPLTGGAKRGDVEVSVTSWVDAG